MPYCMLIKNALEPFACPHFSLPFCIPQLLLPRQSTWKCYCKTVYLNLLTTLSLAPLRDKQDGRHLKQSTEWWKWYTCIFLHKCIYYVISSSVHCKCYRFAILRLWLCSDISLVFWLKEMRSSHPRGVEKARAPGEMHVSSHLNTPTLECKPTSHFLTAFNFSLSSPSVSFSPTHPHSLSSVSPISSTVAFAHSKLRATWVGDCLCD